MLSPHEPLFIFCLAIIALAYSSVGHGGASGYLALMAFSAISTKDAAVIALSMNLVVAGISFIAFKRARHFDLALAWPFLVGAAPFAYMGGFLKVPGHVHKWILAAALLGAAFWLFLGVRQNQDKTHAPAIPVSLATGAGIGLLSGIVGVGGGVFLSPIMILGRWADAKRTASLSALFILVNSVAGLAARPPGTYSLVISHWPMVATGACGAIAGAVIGSRWLPNIALRRALGVILLVAVFKLASA